MGEPNDSAPGEGAVANPRRVDPIAIPPSYPTSTICLDESGTRATGAKFFVIGGIKVRRPGQLARSIRDMRDRWAFEGELKFSEVTRGSQSMYYDLIERLAASDAHLVGCVVETAVHNPFGPGRVEWLVHADITTQLLVGCINRRELVGLMLDSVSTPPECSMEDTVRAQVNRRLKAMSVVSALSVDSKSNDLLQVADMVAGAIRLQRQRASQGTKSTSPKAKVAERLGLTFGTPDLADGRGPRSNIATFRGRGAAVQLRLEMVKTPRTGLAPRQGRVPGLARSS